MKANCNAFEFLVSCIKDYIPLSDAEIKVVESLFTKEHYRKNEVLHREGSICRKLFFVARGILRFSQLTDGEERTYVFRAEGAFCNDLDSFLQQTPSQSSITALGPVTVFSISYEKLQVFYDSLQYGDRFGRLAIEKVFVMVVNHLTTFYSETPQQRYERFVKYHKPLLQRIPQYYIASYIGVSPQALCRIKKKQLLANS